MRERRDMDRLGSHIVWLVLLVPPVSRDYPSGSLRAIDEIARSREQIGGDLLGVAGGNIFLQSRQKTEDLHAGRHLAYPQGRAGLQCFEVCLRAKLWMLHEIR